MFVGVHERQLDDKGRLALPSAFRDRFGDTAYLAYGEQRCIDVFPADAFEAMAEELMRQVRDKEISINRQRAFAHSARQVSLDKQGRVTVDERLRSYAQLTPGSKVIVSGNLDRVELWSPEVYEEIATLGRIELAGGRE